MDDTEHPAYCYMCERLSELTSSELEAVGGYSIGHIDRLDIERGEVVVEGVTFEVGAQVCGYLKGSDEAALFLCTAGALFSDEAHVLNAQGDFLEAYIIDAIGSLSVERAMDKIHAALADEQTERGLKITNRYSPGYCNWPLKDQKPLFAFVGENPTGIVLSESCLMHPIKSVSGMIGIGEKARRRAYG
ncbi:MAG: vitamin B12 dependent-methionine synthase activation domain-containing protein, partial [Rikenellaceae bacterium]|nr:vitamin B12 dependent-methionine synthase activation domain-containing protein [Rikenellaceae bacterium]